MKSVIIKVTGLNLRSSKTVNASRSYVTKLSTKCQDMTTLPRNTMITHKICNISQDDNNI